MNSAPIPSPSVPPRPQAPPAGRCVADGDNGPEAGRDALPSLPNGRHGPGPGRRSDSAPGPRIRRLSSRLTGFGILSASFGALLCALAFAVVQVRSTVAELQREAVTLAEVIGANAATAIGMRDSVTAKAILAAAAASPDIHVAVIALDNGAELGRYERKDRFQGLSLRDILGREPITVTTPVTIHGRMAGTVTITTDPGPRIDALLADLVTTASVILLVIGFVSWPVSRRMQRVYSAPVEALSALAQRIVHQGDYSLRAGRGYGEEMGRLVESFNNMLEQIQARDRALETYSQQLMSRIEGHTQVAQQAQERLKLAMEASSIAQFDCDGESGALYLSEEWGEIAGGTAIETTSTLGVMLESIHPDDIDAFRLALRALLKGALPVLASDVRIRRNTRDYIWIHVRGKVVGREEGRAARILGTVANIDDRKRTEAELARARDAAEAVSRAKSQFLANMSHEIRTPLNGVLGVTELLLDTNLSDRQRDLAQTVQRSGEHLLGIISDILDLSKIEAGRMTLESTAFDPVVLFEDVAQLFAEQANRKELELACDLAPSLPRCLLGDPVRLRQILTNLLGNALKFTERGEVVLRAGIASVEGERIALAIDVTDTGVGIPEEALGRVFEAFAQADETTTRRFGGTGLGLAIVRQLVALMAGTLRVRSDLGTGTTFSLTLPFAVATAETARVPSKMDSLRGRTVLLVDDNATNLEILEHQCVVAGLNVLVAHDAPSALQTLQACQSRIDVAVLDMHMPGQSGLDLARAIRSRETASPGMPLIVVSSLGQDPRSQTLDELGITAWLRKPVRQSELQGSLAKALGRGHAGDEAPPRDERARLPKLRGHVLLVEDNPVNRLVATEILRGLGCTVDTAADGVECLRFLETAQPDLVLMDCQMPEMDGYTATRLWRAQEAGSAQHLPIVALTANAVEGDREACLAAGMDEYLAKPFRRETLAALLAAFLPAEADATPKAVRGEPRTDWSGDILGERRTEIDASVIEMLRRLEGHQGDLRRQVIDAYAETSRRLLEDIRTALAGADLAELSRAAMALKSAAENVGARSVGRLARHVELSARTGELADAPAAIEQLARLSEHTAQRLRDLLREDTALHG